jgi:hypothetical protein
MCLSLHGQWIRLLSQNHVPYEDKWIVKVKSKHFWKELKELHMLQEEIFFLGLGNDLYNKTLKI